MRRCGFAGSATVACALLAAGCRDEGSIAPRLKDGALMTLRSGMSGAELRATLGEPLAITVRPGAPRPDAVVSRWQYATSSCLEILSFGFQCRGVDAEATLIGHGLVSFSVKDEAEDEPAFSCSEVTCPVVPDREHLRFLLERQRARQLSVPGRLVSSGTRPHGCSAGLSRDCEA